jgi:hypothetical protein
VEYVDMTEEWRSECYMRSRDMEGQLELFRSHSNSEKVRDDNFEQLKQEFEVRNLEWEKYKSIVGDQTDMIETYKDLIEEQKLKNLENCEEISELEGKNEALGKDNDELQQILKLYEERVGNFFR